MGIRGKIYLPRILASQIAVQRPTPAPISHNTSQYGPEQSEFQQSSDVEEPLSTLGTSNLLEDAKFYQDSAIEYQNAYESPQHRYTQPAHLVEEASGALHAAESQASQRKQELQRNCETDIQLAVGKVVIQYKEAALKSQT